MKRASEIFTHYHIIVKAIDSCLHHAQLDNAMRAVETFEERFKKHVCIAQFSEDVEWAINAQRDRINYISK